MRYYMDKTHNYVMLLLCENKKIRMCKTAVLLVPVFEEKLLCEVSGPNMVG
jgi:hypothetical protein